MTDPEGTPQETELHPEPSTGEVTADVNQEAGEKGLTADYQVEGEEMGAADYQERMEQFDNVETPVPVVTLPVKTPSVEKRGEA